MRSPSVKKLNGAVAKATEHCQIKINKKCLHICIILKFVLLYQKKNKAGDFLKLTDNAIMLMTLIENAGYEAYAVGGAVRDSLMNKPCHDIDITTSALPEITEKILESNNIKYVETGLKHGTITAVVDGEPYEITTYRTDGEYNDNRHPENVCFVSDIKEDLSRRDFTINAMAYSDKRGLVDLFSGKQDIDNRLIRAVGNPDKRFNEDALRIMRAIRFSCILDFDIEENTKRAIFKNKELLKNISAERLFTELSKLLSGDRVFDVLVEYSDVLAVFIPEIIPMFDCQQINSWHIYDVWTHTCKAVSSSKNDLKTRLTMLFHDIGKPSMKTTDENGINHFKGHQRVSADITAQILKRLKVSNDISNFLLTLIPVHDVHINPDKRSVRRWLSRLGKDSEGEYYLRHYLDVKRADCLAQNLEKTIPEIKILDEISLIIDELVEEEAALSVSDLAVNGFDLMSLGIKGKDIGIALNSLLERVIDEELPNEKEILLNEVKKA